MHRGSHLSTLVAALFAFGFALQTDWARAQPAAPGAVPFQRARAAWNHGAFDAAEPLYEQALERGGLSQDDTLECYVHLGAALSVLNDGDAALTAFQIAATIDPHFRVPEEAGKNAENIAEAARASQEDPGPIALRIQAADEVAPGKPFSVNVTANPKHVDVIVKVALSVKEALSGRQFTQEMPPAPSFRFQVPARMALPGASLLIRAVATDGHNNELAVSEEQLQIAEGDQAGARKPQSDQGHFWSSPWPYILGGIALAAGGVAVYAVTRPSDTVGVGPARVERIP